MNFNRFNRSYSGGKGKGYGKQNGEKGSWNDRGRYGKQGVWVYYGSETDAEKAGDGDDGKSVLVSILEEIVGEHNRSAIGFHQLGERFSLSDLRNKLLNVGSEIDTNHTNSARRSFLSEYMFFGIRPFARYKSDLYET